MPGRSVDAFTCSFLRRGQAVVDRLPAPVSVTCWIRAGLLGEVDPKVWNRPWVVHSQAAGDGRASMKYLAPYVFRVAIGDHRIVSCEDDQVTFTYRKVGSRRPRRMTLPASEFLRRYLQHVLPSGFQKVRHFGFLSLRCGLLLEAVRWLILLFLNPVLPLSGRGL